MSVPDYREFGGYDGLGGQAPRCAETGRDKADETRRRQLRVRLLKIACSGVQGWLCGAAMRCRGARV